MRLSSQRTMLLMLAIGGHGLAVQVLVIRELMAAYAGNEFTAAVVLGTWLGVEAFGAWLAGRLRIEYRPTWLVFIGIAAALLSVAVLPAATLTRPLFGLLAGEQAGLPLLVMASALTAAFPALLHGLLFVEGCSYCVARVGPSGVGQGYAWEALGSAVAGIVIAAVLLAAVPGLAVVAGFGLLLVAACRLLPSGNARPGRRPMLTIASTLTIIVLAALTVTARNVERLAWQWAWPGFQVTRIRDSWFGKTVTLAREDTRTVLYDGVAATPAADRYADEQAAIVPMLYSAGTRDVLLLGVNPAKAEPLLRLPVETVTLVVQDRVLYAALTEKNSGFNADHASRLRVVFDDPRRFLNRTAMDYDCIISSGAMPLSLAANRLATVEYFELCRRRLRPGGVLALPMSGGVTGIGPATARLLESHRATLGAVFDTVAMLALDSPLFIARQQTPTPMPVEHPAGRLARWRREHPRSCAGIPRNQEMLPFSSHRALGFLFLLTAPLARRPLETPALDSAEIARLLDPFRQRRLAVETATVETQVAAEKNLDWYPRGLFLALARRARETGPGISRAYEGLLRVPATTLGIIGAVLLLTFLLGGAGHGIVTRRTIAVAGSGFAAGALVTLGMFVYQTATGALYLGVVLLLACFTLGTVVGGWLGREKTPGRLKQLSFVGAEALLAGVALLMALVGRQLPGWFQFPLLVLVGGALGFQFPAAAATVRRASDREPDTRRSIGRLTAADLAGGIFGILLVVLVILPVAGLGWCFATVGTLKLASLVIQLVPKRPGGNSSTCS